MYHPSGFSTIWPYGYFQGYFSPKVIINIIIYCTWPFFGGFPTDPRLLIIKSGAQAVDRWMFVSMTRFFVFTKGSTSYIYWWFTSDIWWCDIDIDIMLFWMWMVLFRLEWNANHLSTGQTYQDPSDRNSSSSNSGYNFKVNSPSCENHVNPVTQPHLQ